MAEMTPADMSAVLGDRNGYGEWFWIIIILFAFMNNGWNNNGFNDIARESTVNSQFTQRDIAGVNANVSGTKYDLATQIMENRYVNQLAECETQKEILLGNSNLQKDILLGNANINSEQFKCCCEIKNAIRDDGEKTRALIQSIDRDRLVYELNQANTAVANAVQTQNILNSLGNYYPKTGVNPLAVYNTGCGCNSVL